VSQSPSRLLIFSSLFPLSFSKGGEGDRIRAHSLWKKGFCLPARLLTPSPPSLLQGRGNRPGPLAFINTLLVSRSPERSRRGTSLRGAYKILREDAE